MENKYLPIGTVCTVKNINKKVMIISYFSLEYNGNAKLYDYKGCIYPEGLLLSQVFSFNHSDIENIDYIGFKNEQYDIFNNSLNRNTEVDGQEYNKSPVMTNFKFDENGVVVFDGTSTEEVIDKSVEEGPKLNPFILNPTYNTNERKNDIKSIFKFDANGVVISEETVPNTVQNQTPRYQFDENGFVIAEINESPTAEEQPAVAPQPTTSNYKFDENGVVISDGTESSINETAPQTGAEANTAKPASSGYKFDENGVVIADGSEENQQSTEPAAPQPTSNFKFDENGIVISDGTETVAPEDLKPATNPGYKFDENGVVIADGSEENQQPTEPAAAPQPESNIKFDENGFVISE